MAMCEHTWLDGEVWNCWLMKKPCPFVKPEYNDLCIEMKVQIMLKISPMAPEPLALGTRTL